MSEPRSQQEFVLLPPDPDGELLHEFITETRDLIEGAEVALLGLETNPGDLETVNKVFRAFHTVKGTAAFLGITPISVLAHKAETILSRVREREIVYGGVYAELALRSVDMVKTLIALLAEALAGQVVARPELFDRLLTQLTSPEEVKGALASATQPAFSAAAETESRSEPTERREPGKSVQADSSVRVRTDRLDRLIDMVGELVVAQSMVAQDDRTLDAENFELSAKVTHLGKIVGELQDLSMSMRMVPLKATFQKMSRLVRDLTQKNGKLVDLITDGEETEVDRIMVDAVADPLVHMIRNAVDHGIESPSDRSTAGKHPHGSVRLTARQRGDCVQVTVADDGRGLDRERIVAKALQKGLIDSDKGMTDGEIYALIFAPGFSTAEQVTDVSGRGVGMDVVKRNVEALRGRIDISSQLGRGTTFTISLPLTLAITDGMLLRVGRQRYLLPTGHIVMSFRPTRGQCKTVTDRGELVFYRDKPIPLYRLARLLQVPGAVEEPTQALVIVIPDGESDYGLMVDELLGQSQVVAKSLGDAVGRVDGIAGGAVLGDGQIGLILDPPGLVSMARRRGTVATAC